MPALVGGRLQGSSIDDVDGVGAKTGVVEALAGLGHQGGQVVITSFNLLGNPVHGTRQLGCQRPLGRCQIAVA